MKLITPLLLLLLFSSAFALWTANTTYPYFYDNRTNDMFMKANITTGSNFSGSVYFNGSTDKSNGSAVFTYFYNAENCISEFVNASTGNVNISVQGDLCVIDIKGDSRANAGYYGYFPVTLDISSQAYAIRYGFHTDYNSSNHLANWHASTVTAGADMLAEKSYAIWSAPRSTEWGQASGYIDSAYRSLGYIPTSNTSMRVFQVGFNGTHNNATYYDNGIDYLDSEQGLDFETTAGTSIISQFAVYDGSYGSSYPVKEYFSYKAVLKQTDDLSIPYECTYGSQENGSWIIDGETYTSRKNITCNTTESITDWPIWVDYSQFNDSNMLLVDDIIEDNSITDCQALAADTSYYLTADIVDTSTDPCFTGGANAVLNLNGYSVSGDGSNYFYLESGGDDNVTIENGTISNFNQAIRVITSESVNNTFRNLTIANLTDLVVWGGNLDYSLFDNITAYNTSGIVFGANSGHNNVTNCIISNTTGSAIKDSGDNAVIANNTIQNATTGIYLSDGDNDILTNNSISMSTTGIMIEDSPNITGSGNHLFNNTADLNVDDGTSTTDYELNNTIFDNPAGDYQNYTNLSLTDTVVTGQEYEFTWAEMPASPSANKEYPTAWVNMTEIAGTIQMQSIVWTYDDSGISATVEPLLDAYYYSGGWHRAGGTVNTTANTITLTSYYLEDTTYMVAGQENFTLALNLPSDGQTLYAEDYISASYNTSNNYSLTCNSTLNSTVKDSRTVASPGGTTEIFMVPNNGTNTWAVTCYDPTDLEFNQTTASRTIIVYMFSFENSVNISDDTEVVLAPERIFYRNNDSLYLLYFTEEPDGEYVQIRELYDSSVVANYSHALDTTSEFFMAFERPNNLTVLTTKEDNSSYHFLELASGSITVQNTSLSLNVRGNSYWNPYTYANTKHFDSLDFGADSYYLFWLPTDSDSKLIRLNTTSYTLTVLNTSSHSRLIDWQSLADTDDLENWYYAAPYPSGGYDKIGIYYFNGTTQILNKTPINTAYPQSEIEQARVYFERYGNNTYAFIANLTDISAIHLIEEDKTYTFSGYTIADPSNFIFIDEDTFVFFNENSSGTYAFSCYFGGAANCSVFSSDEWGEEMPYSRGHLVAEYRNGTNDVVTHGAIVPGNVTQFSYTTDVYDTKFICYDEQDEFRKTFVVQIYTNSSLHVLNSEVWGHVLTSDVLGGGTKRAYSQCQNGTVRLYVIGLDNDFSLDFYSLNTSEGAYYTFTAYDQFGQPINDVLITAKRFSFLKQAMVTIEQGITDYTGSATLFLEPFVLYQFTISESGYVTLNFDFVPAGTTSIELELEQTGTGTIELPDFYYIWDDVSYTLLPTGYMGTNATNMTFTVSSASSSLTEYGMVIRRNYNGSTTTVYNNSVTTSPAGGTLTYEATLNGTYYIEPYFEHEDYGEYAALSKTYKITGMRGLLQARDTFQEENPISGWSFYLIGVIIAMIAGGFVSRYTVDGAGVASLMILWGFTLFNPSAELVCIAGIGGICITPLIPTLLATVAVGAILYLTRYY